MKQTNPLKGWRRVLPASSVANLYPFNYSGKTDPQGFYIGRDKFGSNVIADFDQRELALIEPLRAMRMVYYLAWVARRWQDPAFPKSFPWMAESDFWLQQTASFTEQVKLLQVPPLQLMPMY